MKHNLYSWSICIKLLAYVRFKFLPPSFSWCFHGVWMCRANLHPNTKLISETQDPVKWVGIKSSLWSRWPWMGAVQAVVEIRLKLYCSILIHTKSRKSLEELFQGLVGVHKFARNHKRHKLSIENCMTSCISLTVLWNDRESLLSWTPSNNNLAVYTSDNFAQYGEVKSQKKYEIDLGGLSTTSGLAM